MIAYKYQYKNRGTPGSISVVPAAIENTEAIQTLAGQAYHVGDELTKDWFGADQYASRIAHYPEGQYIALDNDSGEVVGMTSSMRFQYTPETIFLEQWDNTTGYG